MTFSSSRFVPPTSCVRAITTSSFGCRRMVRELRVSIVDSYELQSTVARATASRSIGGFVPGDSEAGRRRADRVPVAHFHARRGDVVQLGNVLHPRAVGHGRRQRHVQLHQEVRADRRVERLGEVRDLEPRRDAADARASPPARSSRRGAPGTPGSARGDTATRRRRSASTPCAASSTCAAEVLRRQRLLEPAEHQVAVRVRAPARLGDRERLVRVDHQLERVADGRAHGRKPRDVLGDRRPADLHLGAPEPLRLRGDRLVDQLLRRMVEPTALGRVDGHLRLRAAGHLPQRLSGAAALQVPQRGVDRRQREARDRADRGGVRARRTATSRSPRPPGIAADEPRREVVAQQRARPTSRRCRSCTCSPCRSRRPRMRCAPSAFPA